MLIDNGINLSLRETQTFREVTGFPIEMMSEAGSNPKIDSMLIAGALYYIINRRDNPDLGWEEVLDLDINVLMEQFTDDDDEDDSDPLVSASGEG